MSAVLRNLWIFNPLAPWRTVKVSPMLCFDNSVDVREGGGRFSSEIVNLNPSQLLQAKR